MSVKVATGVDSTSCKFDNASKAAQSSGFIATVILSCDSETRISHADSPDCLRGTFERSILHPPVYSAISPIEDDSPPAPLSVIQVIKPRSLASRIISTIFFWVIGSPICTALDGESSVSSSDENVAP